VIDDLPRGWARARVEDLSSLVQYGSSAKTSDVPSGIPVLRMANIVGGRLVFDGLKYLPKKHDEFPALLLQPGDVLFNRTNSPELVGKTAVYEAEHPSPCSFASYLIRLQLHAYEPALIAAYMNSAYGRAWIRSCVSQQVGQANVSGGKLRKLEIPVPPLNEQRRIVAKLEALQARSRRAREGLDAVPPLLEKLRQSILAAAFRGDLTKGWRAKHKDVEPASKLIARTEEPSGKSSGRAASTSVRRGLAAISVGDPGTPAPPGWEWAPLSRVARMESGHTPSRNHAAYWDGGIPWIGIKDARDGHGKEIHTTVQTVSELGLANSSARLLPAKTVCLSRTASVGYVTIMGKPMSTSQDFADWICTPALLPEFLMYALLAEGEHIKTFGEGSTHTTIYFPELKALHVCLAPLEEQREIVRRVRTLLDGVEHLRLNAAERLAQLRVLDRATLAKAFRGALVPQDPNDEPAEVMLARLRGANGSATNGANQTTPKRRRALRGARGARKEEA
jgi:type I restriction enzyme S subunit